MAQRLMAFTVAALMAIVGFSGSQDRAPLHVTSDDVAAQAVIIGRDVY